MATLTVTDEAVEVRFTRRERILGLVRDRVVPRDAIAVAEVVTDPLRAVRGVRAPGLGLPGRRLVGTWRRRGGQALVSVRRGQPAVRLVLRRPEGHEVLVGTDDPDAVVASIRASR